MVVLAIQTALETPKHEYKTGIAAHFTRINNQWGIKLFRSEYKRNNTHRLQSKAHTVDAAPAIGDKFEVRIPNMGYYYGYVTECVTETGEDVFEDEYGKYEDCETEEKQLDWEYEADEYEQYIASTSEYEKLIEKLKTVNITANDLHSGNVGWMPDGRMVAIDFSHEYDENY